MLIPKSVFVSLPQPLCAFRLHEVSGCVQKNCNMHLRWRFHRHAGTHHEQAWIMYDASEPTHPVYHDCWTYISLIPVATIAPELCSILAGRACGSTMWPLTLRMSPSGLNSKNFGESVFRCRKIRPFACLWIRGGGVAIAVIIKCALNCWASVQVMQDWVWLVSFLETVLPCWQHS